MDEEPEPWQSVEKFPESLERMAPGFPESAGALLVAQGVAVSPIISGMGLSRAARLIVSLAISDYDDLLREVGDGAGRAAMRSARTLIEHAINLATVLDSSESAERYMRHLERGKLLMADSEYMTPLLSKGRRSSVQHWQKRARREALPAWDEAIKDYGNSFAKGWHPLNLLERAKRHGLDPLYDSYRLASNVAHGSSAGAIGHFHATVKGLASYAVGRSPELVPLALLVGSEAQLHLLQQLEEADADVDMTLATSLISELLRDYYESIWEATRAFVGTMTQNFEKSRISGTSYLAFSASGRRRWYVEFVDMPGYWLIGRDTFLSRELITDFEPLIEYYIREVGMFNEGGMAVIAVPGVVVSADSEAKPIPATAILPRLVPRQNFAFWEVVEEFGPDGSPIVDIVLEGIHEVADGVPTAMETEVWLSPTESFWTDL